MKKFLKIYLTLGIILSFAYTGQAQDSATKADTDSINASKKIINGFLATSAIVTRNQHVPLWMRSMQNGSIPLSGISGSVFAGAYKDYNPQRQQNLFDWGAGLNTRGNAGQDLEFQLIEAYAKARVGIFQVLAGRAKEITGLVDSTLSTGAFVISGNALGIPKVEISTPDYWEVPFTNGLFALKGSYAHGWMGERICSPSYIQYTTDLMEAKTYLHKKNLYGRLGKPHWKMRLYGGFNHQSMWGNEDKMYSDFGLSVLKTYQYVFTGKVYSTSEIPSSKIGNHLGSIDQGLEMNLNHLQIFAYHQFYYEAGALAKLANVKDGTWGLSIKNTTPTNNRFTWHKVLIEFINSKSQGGEIDAIDRASGSEDYYNNKLYIEGWVYEKENIGNILFTSKKYIRDDLPQPYNEFIVNNRLTAIHAAIDFSLDKWRLNTMLTLSKNFGNYDNMPVHRGMGSLVVYNDPPYFGQANQLNGYFEAFRPLKNGWGLNMALAGDYGELLNKTVGGYLKVVKKW